MIKNRLTFLQSYRFVPSISILSRVFVLDNSLISDSSLILSIHDFQILRSGDIEFVVAPYEADAQLAYLSSLEVENGGIVAVVSEDSDLLAYGCPSVRILQNFAMGRWRSTILLMTLFFLFNSKVVLF